MKLEGREQAADGVASGLDFLQRFNHGESTGIGRRVAVIGGGNTALDCARAARRAGAEVTVYYRRSEAEMPAIHDEVTEACEEGVVIEPLTSPVRVLTREGHVVGLELLRNSLGAPDSSGRRSPIAIPGSEFTVEADTVMLAVGESPDLTPIDHSEVAHENRIGVRFTGATSTAGVFACGDAAFGHGTITQAVATGRKVADAVAAYLEMKQ
jgi:putative selenate reductase